MPFGVVCCDVQERNPSVTRWCSGGECGLVDEEAVSAVLLMHLIRGSDSVYVAVMMGISSIGNPPENGHQLEGGKGVT
jgi:hypothetical protein